MDKSAREISWEAPEYVYREKGADWFFVFGIIVVSLAIATLLLNNTLFALLIAVAGGALAVSAARKPSLVPYSVSVRGIKVGDLFYPYANLSAYYIDEEDPDGPQLLVMSKKRFSTVIVLPLPPEYIDDIDEIMEGRLEERLIEEPLLLKILERLGF
jgi:hypothetical protein